MTLVDKVMELERLQEQRAKDVKELAESLKEFNLKLDTLTAKGRKHIAPSNFVFPKEKRYPIHDLAHAKNALARSSGKPEEAKVKAAVYAKYPQLNK